MKRLTTLLLALALTLLAGTSVFAVEPCAPGGKLIVPEIITTYNPTGQSSYSHLTLTNISGAEIEVTVRLFDHTGAEITGIGNIYVGNHAASAPVTLQTGGGAFPMPVGSTRAIKLEAYPEQKTIIGHAVIEWRCDDAKVTKALVGSSLYSIYYQSNFMGLAKAYLNNGQPF